MEGCVPVIYPGVAVTHVARACAYKGISRLVGVALVDQLALRVAGWDATVAWACQDH